MLKNIIIKYFAMLKALVNSNKLLLYQNTWQQFTITEYSILTNASVWILYHSPNDPIATFTIVFAASTVPQGHFVRKYNFDVILYLLRSILVTVIVSVIVYSFFCLLSYIKFTLLVSIWLPIILTTILIYGLWMVIFKVSN